MIFLQKEISRILNEINKKNTHIKYSIAHFKFKRIFSLNLTANMKNHKCQPNFKKHQKNLTLSTSLQQVNQ